MMMPFRGYGASELTHLNLGEMPSGPNVRRMVHLTQLQHVKKGGGIYEDGLKTRKQLGMRVQNSPQILSVEVASF